MRVLVRLSAIGWALASLGAAQDETAAKLVGDADAAAHQVTALRASGRMTVQITASGASETTELPFRVSRRHPTEARFEIEGDAFQMLTLCWNHRRYSYYLLEGEQGGSEGATEQSCVPAELSGHLADGLVSAVDSGYERVEFEGRAVECRVVRATYQAPQGVVSVAPGSWAMLRNMVRTLWIEPTHKLVLRSRLEARIANPGVYAPIGDGPDLPALVQTTAYSTVEESAGSAGGRVFLPAATEFHFGKSYAIFVGNVVPEETRDPARWAVGWPAALPAGSGVYAKGVGGPDTRSGDGECHGRGGRRAARDAGDPLARSGVGSESH